MMDFLRTYGFLLQEEEGVEGDDPAGAGAYTPGKEAQADARNGETGKPLASMSDGLADEPPASMPRLTVSWTPAFTAVTLACTATGSVWIHREEAKPVVFPETDENRRRRVMRLAFHRLLENAPDLASAIQARPSPWGILTGVRPVKMVQRFIDRGLGEEEIGTILDRDFGLEPSRRLLLAQVSDAQKPFLPAEGEGRKSVSLYLAYPFCPSRCSYCSFPGYEARRWQKWQAPYLDALEREIREMGRAATGMGFRVETLYFGGGTPTSMTPSAMDRLLTALGESFPLATGLEWTVEGGRPETLTCAMLEVLAAHPVTRLCINPQSMDQRTLDRIGRKHTAEETGAAFERVREVMAGTGGKTWRINCDLILGLPGEGPAETCESLARILAQRPDNVTLHALAIKRGSIYKEEQGSLPERADGPEMVESTRAMLAEAGYAPYYLYRQKDSLAGGENVGYTLPGAECLYNILMIGERQTILGLGAGAGSKFIHPEDWSLDNVYNPKDMIQYIEKTDDMIARKVDKLAALG